MDYRDAFNRGIELYPNRLAIVDGERRFTWKQWGERQHRLANALLRLGLKKGDRLGLLLKNCAEYFDAYAAGAKAGIVIIPVNYRLNSEAIAGILREADCRALLVDMEFLPVVKEQKRHLPGLQVIITVGGAEPGFADYEDVLRGSSSLEPQVTHSEDDLAVVIYTTGTTGIPKGAMATRRIMVARLLNLIIEMGIAPEDRWLSAMPLFHIGVIEPLGVILRGGTNVILRDFTAVGFCQLVAQEEITKTFLTPAVIGFILNCPEADQYDLSSLSVILYGAAPMPLETLRRIAKRVPHCSFIQAYGTSECWALIYLSAQEHRSALAAREGESNKLGSIGRKTLLAGVRVVNGDGVDIKPGDVGEILLKGGTIMSGYLDRPDETTAAFRDGWFCTKDLATVDEDGYIYLVDRKNHMIITGGENVYPAQVENALFDHPSIAEVAVIGVPDSSWGEAVKALVVLKPGEELTEREVIEYCAPKMASYAKPKSVDFVAGLPHTATGKVDKLALRKAYWQGGDK